VYFLQYNSQTAALEVSINAGQHRHPRLHQGASINALLRLVRKVKRRRSASVPGTHVRLLRINALHLSCLWLRGPSETLVPVNALAPHLAVGGAYSQHAFLAAVADAAQVVLSLHAKLTRRPRQAKPIGRS